VRCFLAMRSGFTFAAAGLVALCIATPATAATVDIGQVAPPGTTGACGGCTAIQPATFGGPSAAVPAGSWAITSWSIRSGTIVSGFDQLEVWRPVGVNFQLVAQSNSESVMALATTGAVRTFATNISVLPGDVLGIRTGSPPGEAAEDYNSGVTGDVSWEVSGDPTVGQTVGPTGNFQTFSTVPNHRVNMGATLTSIPTLTPPTTQTQPTPRKKCKKHKKRAVSSRKKCKKKRH
jgi:hypothetical protein